MRDLEDIFNEPGIWPDNEKSYWKRLQAAVSARNEENVKRIIDLIIKDRVERYEAINIIVPIWKHFFKDTNDLFQEIYTSLSTGSSPGLLRLFAEYCPNELDEKTLSPRNVRDFLNYDGSKSIRILHSLLPDIKRDIYVKLVRKLFLDIQIGYQDVVVGFLLDQNAITDDEALIALSKQNMNWPSQHLFVKLARRSSLSKNNLRDISKVVLLKELTTITDPLFDELEFENLVASKIVRDSFIKHASYFDLEEIYSIALTRCTPEDMNTIQKSPNYCKLMGRKKDDTAYRENLAENMSVSSEIIPIVIHKECNENIEQKDFFLSHAREDKDNYVIPLATELKVRGMSVWIDIAEVSWGDKLFERINDGIKNSKFVIAFLSNSYLSKKWPRRELYAALDIEDNSGEKKVLPLMLNTPKDILNKYPLIAEKVYMSFDAGIYVIADRCQELIKGTTRIVSISNYPVEDREEIIRAGYSKKESIVRKYSASVIGQNVVIDTDLAEGTRVLAEISQATLEKMAVDIGAHSTVINALDKVTPENKDKISNDKRLMEALMGFAAAVGGRDSLKKYRQRIPATILKGGKLVINDIEQMIPGTNIEIYLTVV